MSADTSDLTAGSPARRGVAGGTPPGRTDRSGSNRRRRRDRDKADKARPAPLPEPLRVPVPDCHTHLDLQDPEPGQALAAAASVGVTTVIQIGCDLPSSSWSVELAGQHDDLWATVALHPNEAPRIALGDPNDHLGRTRPAGGPGALEDALATIDALAAEPKVVAIGETGLDYFRTGSEGVAFQQESFRRHIEIAKKHDKTLVIHDRDAHDDVLRLLSEQGPPERVVFHCYSGDAEMAKTCAEHGYFMSFAGNITFKSAQQLRDALATAPLELVLVETDAPFLTPEPFRGRANASYLIPVTVRAMAELKGVAEDTFAAALGANTRRAFRY